nr:PREDICTED: uncharacterized protein LOC105678895 [Linepithema humile]
MLNALRNISIKYIPFYMRIMDVLEPELIWVDGRCYRFYESSVWKNTHTSAPYMEDRESVCSEEESETDIEITFNDTRLQHSFYVPKIFHSYIIGAKGLVLKKLENETNTTIEVPRKGKDGNIVITARDRKAIISARHRINLLVETSRKKIRYTHFLSIPLNKKEIIDKFNSFKDDVLEKYGKTAYNIDESLFQDPSKLHLTIGMLKLLDINEKTQAIDALKICKEEIINPILKETDSINIQLQGVACMNDDPTEVKILYAQIAHNEKLQELVDKVANYFLHIGLKENEYEKVKLHATLMNTSFKNDYQARFKDKYNASEILKVHKDTFFGETILNQIDISELNTATKDVAYAVTESDVMEINDGISTIFCSEHTLQMNNTFNAFQTSQKPERTTKQKHINLKKSMSIADDSLEYWGFYLLKGASVSLSVCSRFDGASILVVKGERNLRTCGLLEHNLKKEQVHENMFLPGADKQVEVIYESNAQEIDSKESNTNDLTIINNASDVHKPIINVSPRNSSKRSFEVPTNIDNSTWEYTTEIERKFRKDLEDLYETAASYVHKHIGEQSVKNSRKLRHIKRKLKNRTIRKLIKLKRQLKSSRSMETEEDTQQKTKVKDNVRVKRSIRNRELIKPSSLLDQGIKHGGNTDKNFTSISNEESSLSSFETGLFNCYDGTILLAHEFEPSDQCTNTSYLLTKKHVQANHHVEEDGYYYYIFYSDNDFVINDIYAIFDIHKPTFQYVNVTKACINETKCSFSLNMLSADKVIVEIPTKDGIEHDEKDDFSTLISICQPRMGAYMIFPIAMLFFILSCAFM